MATRDTQLKANNIYLSRMIDQLTYADSYQILKFKFVSFLFNVIEPIKNNLSSHLKLQYSMDFNAFTRVQR